MEPLDIFLIICLACCLIDGVRKGFVAQVFAIASLWLAAFLSFRFSETLCARLRPLTDISPTVLNVVSFTVIIIVTIVLMYLLGRLVSGLFKLVLLGWLDRMLGIVFSLIWGSLVLGLVIMLFDTLNGCMNLVSRETLDASAVYCSLKNLAYSVFPFMKSLMFKQ